jgi:hypothetical protein
MCDGIRDRVANPTLLIPPRDGDKQPRRVAKRLLATLFDECPHHPLDSVGRPPFCSAFCCSKHAASKIVCVNVALDQVIPGFRKIVHDFTNVVGFVEVVQAMAEINQHLVQQLVARGPLHALRQQCPSKRTPVLREPVNCLPPSLEYPFKLAHHVMKVTRAVHRGR